MPGPERPVDTAERQALVHLPALADAEVDAEPSCPRRGDVDEWGRSENVRRIVRRIYDPVYRHLFRAEWEGLGNIPDGPALLVANHAGAIPSDAPVIMHGIEEELQRPLYALADSMFKATPYLGTLWSRAGGVVAHPDNAYRLLHDKNELVLAFPEGAKGPSKDYSERYRLRRFGRGGFVEIAMRSGAPVVPIAVVGAEESMPVLFDISPLAKLLGTPYFPITANHLVFGPLLGSVTYFPAKFRLRVLEPVHFDVAPDRSRYSKSRIMDEAETIRQRIQAAIYDMLRRRQSIWRG